MDQVSGQICIEEKIHDHNYNNDKIGYVSVLMMIFGEDIKVVVHQI